MINQKVSHYQIFRKIGKGNCVTLYEAFEETDPQKKVVVKIYDQDSAKDPVVREKFEKLAKKLTEIDYPSILKELEYEIREDQLIQVSELLDGQNLKFAVLIKGLSQEENIKIFKQILDGINFLHQRGIVHRDIKPENIFLIKNYSKIKILDSGLAGVFRFDHPERVSKRVDAPMFLSPEQASGKDDIDERSDIYSLGVLLYFIFSRKLPFENTNSYEEIMQQIIDRQIPELSYHKDVNEIIKKATQKKPEDRYQSCQEMLDDLNKL